MKPKFLSRALTAASFTAASFAFIAAAYGDAGPAHGGKSHADAAGVPPAAAGTVEITMRDTFYEPDGVAVKAGEMVRFVVRNNGQLVHGFSIGTAAMHAAERKEMTMMVEHGVLHPDRIDRDAAKAMQAAMGHGMLEAPNSLLLEPGQSGEMVWTAPSDGEIEFACSVPGHYDAGMQGKFAIER